MKPFSDAQFTTSGTKIKHRMLAKTRKMIKKIGHENLRKSIENPQLLSSFLYLSENSPTQIKKLIKSKNE